MADALDLAIARGPTPVDFSPLSKLLGNYVEGRKDRKTLDVMDAFENVPKTPNGQPDFNAMSTKAFQLGDLQSGIGLSNLARSQRNEQLGIEASNQFGDALATAFGMPRRQPTASEGGGDYYSRLKAQESGGNPAAKAGTSSATGLYQFTDGTWGDLAKKFPQLGLTPQGRTDPAQQERAVKAFTDSNAAALKGAGIDPNPQNLYLAHFLGANGAVGFAKSAAQNPSAPAFQLVDPAAAKANPSLFFTPQGQPLDARTFYTNLTSRFAGPASSRMTPDTGGQPGPTGMQIGGFSSDKMVPLLTMAANNPQLPAESRALAKTLLESALKGDNLTNGQKDYRLYADQERAAGRPVKNFNDWQNENAGEQEYSKENAKSYATTFADLQKQGRSAPGELNTLAFMGKLVESPKFYSGTGGEYVTKFKRALVSMGWLNPGEATDAQPGELFKKLSNRLVLDANNGSLGTGFSNADRDFIQSATANIDNTPEGNKAIIQLAMKVTQRKQEVAQMARDYSKAHGGRIDAGFDDALSAWSNKTPLFPESQQIAGVSGSDMPGGVPAPAVAALKANPNKAAEFDAYYGAGSSARVLGQR